MTPHSLCASRLRSLSLSPSNPKLTVMGYSAGVYSRGNRLYVDTAAAHLCSEGSRPCAQGPETSQTHLDGGTLQACRAAEKGCMSKMQPRTVGQRMLRWTQAHLDGILGRHVEQWEQAV